MITFVGGFLAGGIATFAVMRTSIELSRRKEESEAQLKEKIDIMSSWLYNENLSVRTKNSLRALDIRTVSELAAFPKGAVSKSRNIGKRTMTELTEFMESKGIDWK